VTVFVNVSAGAVTVTVSDAVQWLLVPSMGTIVMSEPLGSMLVDCCPGDASLRERMDGCVGVGLPMVEDDV